MAFIKCSGLIKIYEKENFVRVTALKEINLSIKKESLNAIIGPSGSGKSTLMKILGGIEQISAGEVRVGSLILSSMSDKELEKYRKNMVGFVSQTPENNLIYPISAIQNVLISMKIRGTPREHRKKRAIELLTLVGLKNRINHIPQKLSGGEAQRLSIAVALANNPILILADEPTGELDADTTQKIIDLFKDLNKELGKTIIVATHDNRLAKHCDTLRLANGRITAGIQGFSKNYPSELYKDELVYVDDFGTLTVPEDIRKYLANHSFVRIVFNPKTNIIEIHSPIQSSNEITASWSQITVKKSKTNGISKI